AERRGDERIALVRDQREPLVAREERAHLVLLVAGAQAHTFGRQPQRPRGRVILRPKRAHRRRPHENALPTEYAIVAIATSRPMGPTLGPRPCHSKYARTPPRARTPPSNNQPPRLQRFMILSRPRRASSTMK